MYIVVFTLRGVKHQFSSNSFDTVREVATALFYNRGFGITIQQGHRVWDVTECVRTGDWK